MQRENEYGFYHNMAQDEDIWHIAELYYGDASLWWVIYHANLEVFVDDPELSLPGLEVFIPFIEVKEEKGEVPGFLAQVAADPSYDPMILLAADRYRDIYVSFELYEANGWEPYNLPQSGSEIRYPFRASRPNMRRAERWREIFYRR